MSGFKNMFEGEVACCFGIAMIFIISPILTYFYGNAGTVLGFVVVVAWLKLLEIV
jgi:hypothetical protein